MTIYRCGHCKVRATDWDEMKRHCDEYHLGYTLNAYVQVEEPDGSTRWVATNEVGRPWTTGMLTSQPDEGRKDDSDKNRLELIPPELIFAVGDILSFGARKYSDRNWENGMNWSRVFGALMRHMWAWWSGEAKDAETGKSHLWHAGCCIAFLIAYEARAAGTDDRPTYPSK